MRNGTTPMSHVSGWRQRRNAHHHASPTSAATMPQTMLGSRLRRLTREALREPGLLRGARLAACPSPTGRGFGVAGFELFVDDELRLDHDALRGRALRVCTR